MHERNSNILDAKVISQSGNVRTVQVWYHDQPNARAKEIQGQTGIEYTEVRVEDLSPDIEIALREHQEKEANKN